MNIYKFYIILLLVMSLLSCSDNAEIDVRNIEKNKGPDEIINSFEMILHSGEKTEWLMKADVMKRFNAEKYWWAYIVELETMSDEEKNFYKSDSIHVSDLTDVLTGWGNVEI
ncbi:MAG: hypothetical protein FWG20_02075, partial [Candidatus Cloacimonetes bacterium]|nr:hypothetical protein [Candidatus Cloacimonadota bacterium]